MDSIVKRTRGLLCVAVPQTHLMPVTGSLHNKATAIARWKQWLAPQTQSRRPDPLEDEYQLLAIAESTSEIKEPDEASISSPLDRVYPSTEHTRPSIAFDSSTSLIKSLYSRFLSLWTPSFTYAILGGQLLSFAVTCSSVATSELVERHWVLPSTQTFFR
jgi:hypothetical protein